jgi:hypothetical protein
MRQIANAEAATAGVRSRPDGHTSSSTHRRLARQSRSVGRDRRSECRTQLAGEHRRSAPQVNRDRFMGQLLSSRTAEVANLLYFRAVIIFGGDVKICQFVESTLVTTISAALPSRVQTFNEDELSLASGI